MPKQPSEFDKGVQFVKEHFPKLRIKFKNESWTSKVIAAVVWIFNRRYLADFTTVRGNSIYFPNRAFVEESPRRAFKILMHEFVHMWDARESPFWFRVAYGFPQILFLLFLPLLIIALCIPAGDPGTPKWVTVAVLAILGFVSLLPLPSPGRARAEFRGYAMSMAQNFWRYGSIQDETKEWVAERFTGWGYYKMWSFAADVEKRVETACILIEHETIVTLDYEDGSAAPFALVKDLYERMD
jgi:hypothetical protein